MSNDIPSFPADESRWRPKKVRRLGPFSITEWLVIAAIGVVLIALCFPATQSAGGGGARRGICRQNLHQIGLALFEYHDDYGSFPPAYVADEHGQLSHSWRVLILPYLGQEELYNAYRLDESWDSPHNQSIAAKGAEYYRCPSDGQLTGSPATQMTSYVAVIGAETAWPGSQTTTQADFTDGMASTLLIVETSDSGIHWMEPRDLHFDRLPGKINPQPGPGISSRHVGGAYALRGDGAAWFFSESLSAKSIRALLTIGGGEPAVDLDH
ncbi:MAG: DUF1559 domain-containing protein [Planctomycetales bacterium]